MKARINLTCLFYALLLLALFVGLYLINIYKVDAQSDKISISAKTINVLNEADIRFELHIDEDLVIDDEKLPISFNLFAYNLDGDISCQKEYSQIQSDSDWQKSGLDKNKEGPYYYYSLFPGFFFKEAKQADLEVYSLKVRYSRIFESLTRFNNLSTDTSIKAIKEAKVKIGLCFIAESITTDDVASKLYLMNFKNNSISEIEITQPSKLKETPTTTLRGVFVNVDYDSDNTQFNIHVGNDDELISLMYAFYDVLNDKCDVSLFTDNGESLNYPMELTVDAPENGQGICVMAIDNTDTPEFDYAIQSETRPVDDKKLTKTGKSEITEDNKQVTTITYSGTDNRGSGSMISLMIIMSVVIFGGIALLSIIILRKN